MEAVLRIFNVYPLPFCGRAFDGILLDTYPLEDDEIHQNHYPFFLQAHRVVKPGGMFTYDSDEIGEISPEHLMCLKEVGFDQIRFRGMRGRSARRL